MTVYGFTGPRYLNMSGQKIIRAKLDTLDDVTGIVTGACTGADSTVGQYSYTSWYGGCQHTVIVPDNKAYVDYWWLKDPYVVMEGLKSKLAQFAQSEGYDVYPLEIIDMPTDSSYKDRNQTIVDRSDAVIGFAEYPEDDVLSRRTGTWQTIRLARKAGKLKEVVMLRP